ncbi:MAG: hypothetical protein RIS34_223 [Pseudomonadota bacterium]|jgi:hypothetical protein
MKTVPWRVHNTVMQRGGVKGDIGYSFGDLSAVLCIQSVQIIGAMRRPNWFD